MDQVKAQLAVAAKYWFWIATALVTLLSVGIWWVSSGKLLTEFEAARTKINGEAQKVTQVRGTLDTHPNDISHQQMEKLLETRTDSVMEAWTSVYNRQRDILVWPVEELKEDFVREFADLVPIESKVDFPTPEADEKETTLRNRYRFYIGNVLPNIAEIAKTKWTANFDKPATGIGGMGADSFGGGSESYGATVSPGGSEMMYGGPGAAGAARDEGPLVTWDTSSQEKLLSDLFPWRGGQPTTLDVLYSQENLWILRQLMQIVAAVNGDAGQRFQAKIRGINRISIGRSVPTVAGSVSKPARAGGAGAQGLDMFGGSDGSMMDGMPSTDMMSGGPGMMGDSAMGGPAASAVDPGDNRYVDTQGVPVTASQLRSALSSKSPTDAFMAVAKRVPVMMTFKMDQRSVPELLAVCGSVPLMVEVKHVRILPASGVGAMTGTGGAGNQMGSAPMGASFGGSPGGDMYGGSGEGNYGATATSEQFPLDMLVEVYGIIYIYNPPQTEALGIDQVNEDTVVEGTALSDRKTDTETPAATATEPVDPAAVTPDPAVPVVPTPAEPAVPAPAEPVVPTPPVDAAPSPPPAAAGLDPATDVPAVPVQSPPDAPAAGASFRPSSSGSEIMIAKVAATFARYALVG